MDTFANRLITALQVRKISAAELSRRLGVNEGTISNYKKGVYVPKQRRLEAISEVLDVSIGWLMGSDVSMERTKFHAPKVTEEYVTFPVIGDLAAGYDHIAAEDWTGETINIPKSYLRGRGRDEFIVLSVSGDSMYPMYQDGDKVLILRQEIQPDHGQVCAVLYNDNLSTLKKVSWGYGGVILEPINPMYQPIEIKGEDLAHFRVIGVPRLLIREINE